MQYSEARQGRIFVLRLENGEVLHEVIESFARTHAVKNAAVMFLGAAQAGSRMVSGTADEAVRPMPVNINVLRATSEAAGVGTLFPNEAGQPVLHMHASFGHKETVFTGCIRAGVVIWHVGEVMIFELLDINGARMPDADSGFELLTFEDELK